MKKPMHTYNEEHNNIPIIQKAKEIVSLTDAIVQSIDEDEIYQDNIILKIGSDPDKEKNTKAYLDFLKQEMMNEAYTLSVKLQAAYSIDLYTHKMEYATLIKLAARSLLTHTSGLKMYGYKRSDYLKLLRNAIEEFRILFVEWINTFDKYNDIPDGWGLFYDPNYNYELPEWDEDEELDDEEDDMFWKDIGDDDEDNLPDWMKEDDEEDE